MTIDEIQSKIVKKGICLYAGIREYLGTVQKLLMTITCINVYLRHQKILTLRHCPLCLCLLSLRFSSLQLNTYTVYLSQVIFEQFLSVYM